MCMCVPAWIYVHHIYTDAEIALDPPEVELEVIVSYLIWVLGTKSSSLRQQ